MSNNGNQRMLETYGSEEGLNILLTGFSTSEVDLEEPRVERCYLCKRVHGEDSVIIKVAPDGERSLELKSLYVEYENLDETAEKKSPPKAKFLVNLCFECHLILESVSKGVYNS